MEESVSAVQNSLLDSIKETFACKETDVRAYSPLTLAYIGDVVYDLIIRTVVVERGNRAANELHKRTIQYVKAQTQAQMIEALLPLLSEEEEAVYKRGRNAKSYTSAKNASIGDYRKATGFEALLGYLYLLNRMDRVLELCKQGIEAVHLTI
ncbi:MAG: ribonuclease III [Lachnospiraceae bacterium]|nr:ribonuclease III [Lachnospiraceae bacterium]